MTNAIIIYSSDNKAAAKIDENDLFTTADAGIANIASNVTLDGIAINGTITFNVENSGTV